jgi:hypothetical protein
MPHFFRRKYLFKNHNALEWEGLSPNTIFFQNVSVHFYSLAPTWNKCTYALPVPFLALVLSVFGSKWWTHQVLSAVTIWDRKASLSASKRANSSEEMTFLSVLYSIVRLRGNRLIHHRWSWLVQDVRKMGRPFYPGMLHHIQPGSIILNARQKGLGQGMVPTGHTHTCFSLAQGCRSGLDFAEK